MKNRLLLRLLMVVLLGAVLPAFAKDRICDFQALGLSISFGALDPSTGNNAQAVVSAATLNADKAGDCDKQVTMTIAAGNGQNYSGSRRLTNAAGTDFIPYSLIGLPISTPGPGNNIFTTFTFQGVILWNAYANAPAGSYSDTVMISVTP